MYILCASGAMHPLEPLAQLYRDFAARADDRAQERVGGCLLRVVFHRDVQMLKLVVSELLNHFAQERYAWMVIWKVFECFELAAKTGSRSARGVCGKDRDRDELVIVLADDSLDGLCAGHGCLLAHQGRYCPETVSPETGDLPEDGWTDMVLELHLVHDGEMLLLLVPHFLHKGVKILALA